MINFSLVDVKSIISDIPRSDFSEADLEQVAELILETGGVIKPLVVKPTGAESYTVVDGHFEYYAAVRAKEKNPRKGEMVNAFVISPKLEDLVVKQALAIQDVEFPGKVVKPIAVPTDVTKLESRLTNLELRFEKQINDLKSDLAQEKKGTEDKIKEIQSSIPKKISPLEVFNDLDQTQLTLRLINAGVKESIANKIFASVEKERKKKKFTSLSDVVARVKIPYGKKQIRGITPEKMVEILDIWSRK
jgi:hypothetical protein